MPPARQRRRKKHRGTQAGTVRHRGRTSRPVTRAEARQTAAQRRASRIDRPPSWRSAINRAAVAASVFLAVLLLLFRQDAGPSVRFAAFMFVVYIPLGYAMDSFMYRLRERRKQREQQEGE
jgi:hypothetical protein